MRRIGNPLQVTSNVIIVRAKVGRETSLGGVDVLRKVCVVLCGMSCLFCFAPKDGGETGRPTRLAPTDPPVAEKGQSGMNSGSVDIC